jgi:hypothetical protein
LFAWAANANRAEPHPVWKLGGRDVDLILLAFATFLFFALLGTLFILTAIGPRFNMPSAWSSGSPIPSRLFFMKINDVSLDDWKKSLKQEELSNLKEHYLDDYIYETHLLAGKTAYKYRAMAVGVHLYRIAIGALAAFLAFAFVGQTLGVLLAFLMISVFAIQYLLQDLLETKGPRVILAIALTIAALCLAGLAVDQWDGSWRSW